MFCLRVPSLATAVILERYLNGGFLQNIAVRSGSLSKLSGKIGGIFHDPETSDESISNAAIVFFSSHLGSAICE